MFSLCSKVIRVARRRTGAPSVLEYEAYLLSLRARLQGTTCLLSQLLSKVTHMLQFLHQMFNLFALLKPATPLTNGAINETLQ